ncbi:MAG TPA: permease prefix domain 1-containing protein, partial [Gemmatimonadaceae bacterium]|nr:permease prefix domain 1-containing protein [Gemmatimonadaceae bacterium]
MFRFPALTRVQAERDVDEELDFHLAMREAKLRAAGLDDARARSEAHRRFGNRHRVRAACLAADRQGRWRECIAVQLGGTAHDLRRAARSLRRAPTFTLAATLLLALGIAGTAAVFSVVNAIAFRPPPYPHPERLALASIALDESVCGTRCTRDPTPAE